MFDITPKHDFLVGIDSDGCAFDTMELKHKECFIPNIINHYDLQGVSKYAREAAEFVNLYSKSRGHQPLSGAGRAARVAAAAARSEGPRREGRDPAGPGRLDQAARPKLGNPALEKAVAETGDPDLKQRLAWSQAVNEAIAEMVRGVPPFPLRARVPGKACRPGRHARRARPRRTRRSKPSGKSTTSTKYVVAICGQEIGTQERSRSPTPKKYPAESHADDRRRPGRLQSGRGQRLLCSSRSIPAPKKPVGSGCYDEGIDRFFDGTFAGDYQQQLLDEFDTLPARTAALAK